MRFACTQRLRGVKPDVCPRGISAHHRSHGRRTETHAGIAQKLPPRAVLQLFVLQIHLLFLS